MERFRIKQILLFLLLVAMVIPAAAFAQEEGEEGEDPAAESYPCNPLVLSLLEMMGREGDCDYFEQLNGGLGVSPGQFMQAWRMVQMIEPDGDPQTIEGLMEDLLGFKVTGFGWGQLKLAYRYSSADMEWSDILTEFRSGDVVYGWGQIKKAKTLVESEDFDYDNMSDALTELESLGWGEIKAEAGYSGPPPWSNGAGKDDVEPTEKTNNGGKKDKEGDEGPPYGNAKGHGKDKNKGGEGEEGE